MIARIWTARTTAANIARYREYFERHLFPDLRAFDGYGGAMLLNRSHGDEIEVIVITRWRSLDAVRSFAGADVNAAVVPDEAAVLLTSWDRHVRHYDVVLEDVNAPNV